VPLEEALRGEWFVEPLRGVEHHVDDAVDRAILARSTANVDPQTTRHRRSHLILIEVLALDLARLQHLLSEREELGVLLARETQALHPPEEPPLPVPQVRQQVRHPPHVPLEVRPVRRNIDVDAHTTQNMRKL